MDIAKIRKKLKEAKEARQAEKEAEAEHSAEPIVGAGAEFPEAVAGIIPSPHAEEKTGDSGPSEETEYPAYEKPPEEDAEHVALQPDIEEEEPEAEEAAGELPAKERMPSPKEPESTVPPSPDKEQEGDMVELLTFKLAKEDYAFKVSDVEEILKLQRFAKVPRTEKFMLGITSLRGKIIPLIDLRIRFSLSEDGAQGKEKIVILKGPKGSIGALVDRVIDVIRIPSGDIVEPPSHLSEAEAKFIEGVVVADNRFISVVRLQEAMNFRMSGGADERKA
ncbi:MAG: chemotaxis protein CheW [Thermodesulfovibrionales bacterium]|nr:chemotaxis protein CheW [Thermodesulfovibrionales bacterium]